MAGVTTDILENMLRSNFNNLKSFAEQLNAELTEEGQEEESRQAHATDINRILKKMATAEAHFRKSVRCMENVSVQIQNQIPEVDEEVEQTELMNVIKNTIRMIEGKNNDATNIDVNEKLGDIDEGKVISLLERNKGILDSYHPLQIEADGEEHKEEEDRICQWLERKQMKSMAKMEESVMGDRHETLSERTLQENSQIVDSDEEEPVIAPDSFEQVPQASVEEMAAEVIKFDHMWTEYKEQIINEPPLNIKEMFDKEMKNIADFKLAQLPLYSKFGSSILELFSKEAVVVVSGKKDYTDPITRKAIVNPVRNIKCQHIYERDTMFGLLNKKKNMSCPFLGCSNRSFSLNDLIEDEDIAAEITQIRARQIEQEEADEDEETDREDVDSDEDTQSQEIL